MTGQKCYYPERGRRERPDHTNCQEVDQQLSSLGAKGEGMLNNLTVLYRVPSFQPPGKRTLRMSSSLLDLPGAEWAAALFLLALSGEFSKTSPNPRLYHSHNGLHCWGSSPLRTQVSNGGICVFSTPCCNWVSRLVYPTTPNLSLSNPASQELSPVLFPGFFLPMTLCRSVSHGGCSDLRSASLGFTVTMGNRPRTRVNKDSELRVLGTWVHLS